MNDKPSKPLPAYVENEARRLKLIYNDQKTKAKAYGIPFSQETIAERCGWAGQSAVSQYLNGRMPLNIEALLKLARALEFDPGDVSPRLAKELPDLRPSDRSTGANASVVSYVQNRLPVIGQASAGRLEEIIEKQDVEEWVIAPGPTGPRAFALRLEGISMEPKFQDGDKVIIDPDLDWGIGDYVFARKECDNTGTFKQIKREGLDLYLCAINENFAPRYTPLNNEWVVVGKARWKLQDL